MSLLQKCLETYDNMEHLVAKKVEGKATLAPIGHTILKCDLMKCLLYLYFFLSCLVAPRMGCVD